jgi:hypothetical protein
MRHGGASTASARKREALPGDFHVPLLVVEIARFTDSGRVSNGAASVR